MGSQKFVGLVFAALAVTGIADARKKMKTTVLSKPEYCSDVVGKGDHAYILHKGYYKGELIDANPEDENGDPEPLKIVVGKGHVLAGMEQALDGMCLNEKVEIIIPPHLAYDDKSKGFQRKPVPDGSIVKYEMHVVDIQHPGTILFTLRGLINAVINYYIYIGGLLGAVTFLISRKKNAESEATSKAEKKALRKKK